MNKKIAYITDLHLDEQVPLELGIDPRKNWKTILDDLKSRGINEIIFGGDIGDRSSNEWFFKSIENYKMMICLGNHDTYDEVTKFFNPTLSKNQDELYYSQSLGDYQCLICDTSSEKMSQKQFDWLKKEIDTHEKIIVFVHHPIFSVDAMIDKQFSLMGRERIKALLLNSQKNIVVFTGHYHFEDETKEGKVLQYITTAASYQGEKIPNEIKINGDSFGYRIIELVENKIKTQLVIF